MSNWLLYKKMSRSAVSLALLGALWALPSVSFAQDDAKINKALAGAVDDYDMLMLDDAEAKLNEALAHANRNKLRGPKVAKLYLMLGIVVFARDRDEKATEQAFMSALEQDKDAKIEAVYETPDLTKLFQKAKSKAKPPSPDTSSTTTTSDVKGFEHKALMRAPAGQALAIEVQVPRDMPVFNVYIYHRRFGESDFDKAELKPQGATGFVGEVPAKQVRTSQLEYYIEATDRGGAVLANFASAKKPHMVLLTGSDDIADPPDDQDPNKTPVAPKQPSGDKHVYVSLGAGTAFGLLTGGEATANPSAVIRSGLAPAFGHAKLDLGWVINESMRLGIFLRWQFSPPQNFALLPDEAKGGSFPSTKAECLGFGLPGDCIIGLQYKYFFTEGEGPRFYSSVGAGVGRVRHWLQVPVFSEDRGIMNPACNDKEIFVTPDGQRYCNVRDTVRTGWGHFGVGAGVTLPVASFLELYADSYLMFLALDQTSITLDLTVGLNFLF
jgi:hypothetical protein